MFDDDNHDDGDLQEEEEEAAVSVSSNRRRSQPADAAPARPGSSSASAASSSSSSSKKKVKSTAQVAADDRFVGDINMVHRKIASEQLEEYMDGSSFHTAAQLAFYSHAMLNTTVLLDSVDLSNTQSLCGPTRICTVAIVLTHSGSTLTAVNGQAFAKLELGTLRTGSTVTLLLFGEAYRAHPRASIGPGTVIGLRRPRLLPPKKPLATPRGGGGTAATTGPRITFSLSDADQLLSIAQSRDFGYCRGSCRGKDERGVWVADARPCRNIVDTSVGRYCKEHQKQQAQKEGGRTTTAKKQHGNITNLKELRQNTMIMARNQQVAMASQRHCNNNKPGGQRGIMTLPTKAMGRHVGPPGRVNSLLNPSSSTVPVITMRMNAPPPAVATTTQRQSGTTTTNRFNGSVLVPPPSTLFGRCHPIMHTTSTLSSGPRERKPDEILEQQKRIAQQADSAGKSRTRTATNVATLSKPAMKLQTLSSSKLLNNKKSNVKVRTTITTAIITPPNAFAAAFGPTLDGATNEAVRNARSSFACEANADEYARGCLALDELETLEAKKRVREPPTEKRLVQIWHCRNCQKEFRTAPQHCYRRHHTVRVERILRQDETLSDKRQKRTDADQADGGLVLGQGLDWSGFIHSN